MIYRRKKGSATVLVVLILLSIGILMGVLLYIFDPLKGYFMKQDEKRISDVEKVVRALNFYYRDFGKYPDYADDEFIFRIRDKKYPWGNPWKPYMDSLPEDPTFYKKYAYWVDRDNNYQSYRLYSALDRPDLLDVSCGSQGCPNVPFENMCSMYAPCNFGLTSGNISP